MKGKFVAVALIFLGIGALMGMAVGRASSRVSLFDRGGSRVERIVVHDGLEIEGMEGFVVEIPELPEMPEMPELSEMPEMPPMPHIRTAPHEIVVEHGPSGSIFSLIQGVVRTAANLLALLVIVIGVVIVMRQRNQPVEKAPPTPTAE
jgi:hypothetical protein